MVLMRRKTKLTSLLVTSWGKAAHPWSLTQPEGFSLHLLEVLAGFPIWQIFWLPLVPSCLEFNSCAMAQGNTGMGLHQRKGTGSLKPPHFKHFAVLHAEILHTRESFSPFRRERNLGNGVCFLINISAFLKQWRVKEWNTQCRIWLVEIVYHFRKRYLSPRGHPISCIWVVWAHDDCFCTHLWTPRDLKHSLKSSWIWSPVLSHDEKLITWALNYLLQALRWISVRDDKTLGS